MQKLVPVVLCPVVSGKRLLLIRKSDSMFSQYWRFPSGRVVDGENIATAAQRVLLDQSGLGSAYNSMLGIISQDVDGQRFIINVCKQKIRIATLSPEPGIEAMWVNIDKFKKMKDVLPSDVQVANRMIFSQAGSYFECKLLRSGEKWILERFESTSI
jgi:hypothetical protein